jgi:hypothetical protein
MAVQAPYEAMTFEAGEDLSDAKWHFVTLQSDGQVDISGAGDSAVGVAMTNPDAAGKAVTVALWGRVKVLAGGTIAAGAQVASNAAGRAIARAGGARGLGVALKGADNNEYVEVILTGPFTGPVA